MSGRPVVSPLAPSVWARLKQAVRRAIDRCDKIEGAQQTTGRGTVVGDWNNINTQAFPPIDCALAMDEIALIKGERPEIAHAYAAALGGVFIQLPDFGAGDDVLAGALAEATAEFGDVARRIVEAQRDGVTTAAEREAIVAEGQEALVALQKVILLARGAEVVPIGAGTAKGDVA